MPKIATCLWFVNGRRGGRRISTARCCRSSRVDRVWKAPLDYPAGQAGDPILVEFTLAGQAMQGLNGGTPMAAFSSAASIAVETADQAETDRLWAALTADGGKEIQCGWLNDRWGIPWQIVPKRLTELMNDPDRDRAKRVMQSMMTMVKIDIAELERAAAG